MLFAIDNPKPIPYVLRVRAFLEVDCISSPLNKIEVISYDIPHPVSAIEILIISIE